MRTAASKYSLLITVLVLAWNLNPAVMASKVRVLYTGDPYPGVTPYIHMRVEPLLEVTPVQASTLHYAGISRDDIRRAIRVYMPRTYRSLVESYDVLIISDANVGSFSSDHHRWFKDSVSEGLGFVMVGGYETFGGVAGYPSWENTPVADVLPVSVVQGLYWGGPMKIVNPEHVFMKSLPWRPNLDFMQNYQCNIVNLRDGADLLAVVTIGPWGSSYSGYENPFYSTWTYVNGTVFAMTGDWTPDGGWVFLRWDYLPDFVTNLMLYCAKRPVPHDISLVHTLRKQMATLGYRRLMATSLVDFIEGFGADTGRLLAALDEVDAARDKLEGLYLDLDFVEALEAANAALSLMDQAELVAERSKNEALLWIYLSEWLAVTSTCLLAGLIVWALMIRRRLYRDVVTTRFPAS